MKFLNVFSVFVLALATSFSYAGNDGGGGMVIYKDGELQTLAEAGVLLERFIDKKPATYPKYYMPSKKTIEEVDKILALMNKKVVQPYRHQILPERGTFFDVDDISPEDYGKIYSDYSAVLQKYAQFLDESILKLAAYSKNGKTYILPTFKLLTPFRQALVLVHEKFMRESVHVDLTKRLALTLELDAQILKLVRAKKLKDFDPLAMALVLRDLSEHSVLTGINGPLIAHTQSVLGRPLLVSELVQNPPGQAEYGKIPYDPSVIQKFNDVVPYLARQLENHQLSIDENGERFSARGTEKLHRKMDKFCRQNYKVLQMEEAMRNDALVYFDPESPFALPAYLVQCDSRKKSGWISKVFFNAGSTLPKTARSCGPTLEQQQELDKQVEEYSRKVALATNPEAKSHYRVKVFELEMKSTNMARELMACAASRP